MFLKAEAIFCFRRRGFFLNSLTNDSHTFSPVSATPGTSAMSKRPREEEETASVVTDTEATQEDTSRAPISKKLRIIQRVGPEVRLD